MVGIRKEKEDPDVDEKEVAVSTGLEALAVIMDLHERRGIEEGV